MDRQPSGDAILIEATEWDRVDRDALLKEAIEWEWVDRDALLKEATEAFPEGCAEYLKLRPELSGEAGGFAGPQSSQGAASQPPA